MKQKNRYIRTGLTVAVLAGSGMAAEPLSADNSTLDSLNATVGRFVGKAGVDFSGDFSSRGLIAPISGPLIDSTKAKKTREDIMFTALDLKLTMGPHAGLKGRADIRLHEDWRNMFGSYATPLSVQWLSMNGNVKDVFFYSVGDYKEKFSPLTLWAPEPEIMFEPYIFARQRKMVMDEVYAGNNERVLQGANVMFAAKISPVFEELTSKSFFARNRKVGKEENTIRPEAVDVISVPMDRYSAGENLFLKFRKDAELGATFVYTGDAYATHKMGGDKPENKKDVDKNLVMGFSGAIGTGLLKAIDTTKINVRMDAEMAYSLYQTYALDTLDAAKKLYSAYQLTDKGLAIDVALGVTAGIGSQGKASLDVSYISNAPKFVNEMAQSPVFFNRQLLNTGVKGAYNSFDGLYKSVFNYTPAELEFKTKEPENKIAWTRGVLTHDEILIAEGAVLESATEKSGIDRTFSPVLHLGKATPNRKGLDIQAGIELLDKAIILDADVKLMNTAENFYKKDAKGSVDTTKVYTVDYKQFVGGASLDVAQFGDWWSYPLVLSGSLSHSETFEKNAETKFGTKSFNEFGNASLYWKFWKRAALMGGAQVMLTRSTEVADQNTEKAKALETNIGGGLEYTVAEGGVLSFTAGNVAWSNLYKVDEVIDKSRNFSTMQYDLLLTVKF